MRIDRTGADSVRTEQSREGRRGGTTGAAEGAARPSSIPAAPMDRVELSDAGKALAAQAAGGGTDELTVERIAAVRERILTGAYDSLDVVDQVARRILSSDGF